MTTQRRDAPYVLDRLLTRQASIPGPVVDSPYRFATKETGIAAVAQVMAAGRWAIDSADLYLYQEDADGLSLPVGGSLPLDDTTMVTITAGAYTFTTVLLSYETLRDPIGGFPLSDRRHLTLAMVPTIPGTEITITLPIGSAPTIITGTQQVWCTRLDFRGRDQINIVPYGVFTLADSRIIVRNDGSWSTMDVFELEGASFNVRGIAEIGGRKQYLELLVRTG